MADKAKDNEQGVTVDPNANATPIDEQAKDPVNQDQPTPEQADAQAVNTKFMDKANGAGNTDQSQEVIDTEQAVGYRGHNPNPVPNEAYTVAGVTRGDATPETDYKLAERARVLAHIGHPENPLTLGATLPTSSAQKAGNAK